MCVGLDIHLSLLVSISPNSNFEPLDLLVAALVADAPEVAEKDVDGLLARTKPDGLSRVCCITME